jgi:tetratricopeptide (TPR) repeat protein
MEKPPAKFRLLGEIADVYIKAGDNRNALEALSLMSVEANKMKFVSFKSEAKYGMVSKYLEIGELDAALDMAETIFMATYRPKSFSKIAVAYAESGQLEKAEKIAVSIGNMSERIIALSKISAKYVALGNLEKASELFSNIATELDAIANTIDKGYAFERIMDIYLTEGFFNKALELINEIKVESDKGDYLTDVVIGLSKAGLSKEATEIAQQIEDISQRLYLLIHIAGDYKDTGSTRKAAKVLSKAFKLADQIHENLMIAENYEKIALLYDECDKNRKAAKILSEAQKLVEACKIEGDMYHIAEQKYLKASALSQLASAYYKTGQKDQSALIFKDAKTLAESIEPPRHHDDPEPPDSEHHHH